MRDLLPEMIIHLMERPSENSTGTYWTRSMLGLSHTNNRYLLLEKIALNEPWAVIKHATPEEIAVFVRLKLSPTHDPIDSCLGKVKSWGSWK